MFKLNKRKLINLSLNVIGGLLLVLIVLLTPLMTEIAWISDGINRVQIHDKEIVLMVLLPFFAAVISFLVADKFKTFTKEDAERQLETQLKNGVISQNHYFESKKELELYDFRKKQDLFNIEFEKEKLKKQIENEKNKLKEESKNEAEKLENN